MRTTTRPTGVTLTRLDTTRLAGLVTEQAKKAHPEDEALVGVTFGIGDLATVEHDGTTYVICSEGVGWEVSDSQPLELDVYLEYGPASISIIPAFGIRLSPAEVEEYIDRGEPVDLAEFIRSFGARLESNFRMWHNTLSA